MLRQIGQFASKTFLVWMLLTSFLGFIVPSAFTHFAPWIPYLLGVVMLGMGLSIRLDDFKIVFKYPKPVIIGVVLQYTIMPLLAYLIVKLFHLSPEVAIGVLLVGCCPGGTSSNVISYLAKANVALSVAVTSVSTILSPFVTPSLMFLMAHQWMDVSFLSMFESVSKVVLIPIIAGLIIQRVFYKAAEKADDILPLVSVIAISIILGTVVASSKTLIIETGLLIFAVVILHNVLGYLIGYTLSALFKLTYEDKKTLSIEVGMQNSSLAASLATVHFNPLAAVPGAVFSFVHCITGPTLARYWSSQYDKRQKNVTPLKHRKA
ncbi:bile acid:sodium symporter family protein [Staphylococcus hyicus]|uniref:bile acid:sodium symporter family protein n=1 Tax=Staphylococcus hyicus TaxID=1284 RepID=UPI00211C2F64|nr:bile acid:sodium symporter family protein [Staphylococcus hyicus]MCQ9300269.1 bile acid:sodium symporter family protein [Staphylococcus hyicus]